MAIDDASIDRVRRAADIVAVVGEYVQLKRRGQNHVGLCPFHEEKTPSFNVNAARQFYHCFGCGVGGDVFSFVMEMENLGFVEAVRLLARKYNITLTETGSDAQRGERESLLELLERAAAFYARLIESAAGRRGREFLEQRRVPATQIKRFGLGLAPPAWDELTKALVRAGAREEQLLKAGLCARSERSGKLYDRLRDRVVFPVRDVRGRVMGFGGRDLSGDERAPKYLNSPETPLYHKGEILYGLDLARKGMRKAPALLVEGYLDVISLHAVDATTAVAPLGTALTAQQAKLLGRFAGDHGVTVIFDGDSAGQAAALRSLAGLVNADLAVRVAVPAAGSDPDDVAREGGRAAVDELLNGALELDDFLTRSLVARYDLNSTADKLALVDELAELLLLLRDRVAVDLLIDRFAGKLGVTESALRADLRDSVRRGREGRERHNDDQPVAQRKPRVRRPDVKLRRDVSLLLWLLFNDTERGRRILAEAAVTDFPVEFRPALEFAARWDDNAPPPIPAAAEELDENLRPIFYEAVDGVLDDDERDEALDACLASLRQQSLRAEQLRLRAELREAYRVDDRARIEELLQRKEELEKRKS